MHLTNQELLDYSKKIEKKSYKLEKIELSIKNKEFLK